MYLVCAAKRKRNLTCRDEIRRAEIAARSKRIRSTKSAPKQHTSQLILPYTLSDTLADYFFPAKPAIASEGEECECPNCTAKFVYQRNELTYQPLKSPRD
jgi:hypothetical protein